VPKFVSHLEVGKRLFYPVLVTGMRRLKFRSRIGL